MSSNVELALKGAMEHGINSTSDFIKPDTNFLIQPLVQFFRYPKF